MEVIVITMPIAPYNKFSVGKLSTPILAEALAKKMQAKFIIAVNLLDSYKERDINSYQSLLQQYDIHPDEYWIDKENIDKLLEKIQFLIDSGYIRPKVERILTCDCQKVEIPERNIATINMNDASFEIQGTEYYCKSCHGKCSCSERNVLNFDPKRIPEIKLHFFPDFLNKDVATFFNTVGQNEIIISRSRNTGIKIMYDGIPYNLDIDFVWGVYLALFPSCDKVVLCSNHQLYQLFMVAMLEKCFNTSGKTICLATPYLNIHDKALEQQLQGRVISLKLFTLLNQKWAKKENSFDEGLLTYINRMAVEKKQMLYELVSESMDGGASLPVILKQILTKEFNRQELQKRLQRRRRRKNV